MDPGAACASEWSFCGRRAKGRISRRSPAASLMPTFCLWRSGQRRGLLFTHGDIQSVCLCALSALLG
jgi:hypothetical protein